MNFKVYTNYPNLLRAHAVVWFVRAGELFTIAEK